MRRLLIMTAVLALTGCGNNGANPQAAQQRASDITKAQVAASGGLPGANIALKDDASGCFDKTRALALIAASKSDDKTNFINLWAAGMKDQTCRGFAPGLPIKLDHKEGNLACILPGDDPKNTTCYWIEAKAL